MNQPNLPDNAALLVALERWTQFARECGAKHERAREATLYLQCALEHATHGLTMLDQLTEEAA